MLVCLCVVADFLGADAGVTTPRELTVRVADSTPLTAVARTVVTAVFLVENPGSESRTVLPVLVLPSGWRSMAPLFPFELESGASDTVLGSFIVPSDARAGIYRIGCNIGNSGGVSQDEGSFIQVIVPVERSLDLSVVSAPKNALSGDAYEIRFAASNNGNIDEAVVVRAESGSGYPFDQDAGTFTLAPGASREVAVRVRIPTDIEHAGRHLVGASLKAAGQEGPTAEARTVVDVMPRTPAGEVWHRLPVELAAEGSYSQGETARYSSQLRLSGTGTLDDGDKQHLAYSIAPPAFPVAPDAEPWNARDGTYYLGYWTDDHGLYLGDRDFTVSSLTSGSASGRGAEAFVSRGPLTLKGYACDPVEESGQEIRSGATLKYGLDKSRYMSANYSFLEGGTAGGIWGFSGFLRPYDAADIAFEAATGGDGAEDYVYALGMDGRESGYAYQIKAVRAGAGYRGPVRDIELYSANGSLSLFDGLTVSAAYNKETRNPGLDGGSAPSSESVQAGIVWNLASGTRFSAQWKNYSRRDLSDSDGADERAESLSARFEWTRDKLWLDGTASLNHFVDLANDRVRQNAGYGLSATYRPDSDLMMSVAGKYSVVDPLLSVLKGHSSLAVYAEQKYRKATTFKAGLETVNMLDSYFGGSDQLTLSFRHDFPDDAVLSLDGSYSLTRDPRKADTLSVSATYRLPLSVPVSRRTNVGTVRGRVSDAVSGQGIPGILVSLEGTSSVSDADGYFLFPAVTAGTYQVFVNTTLAGVNLVPTADTPESITVADRKDTSLKVILTAPMRIFGIVNQYTTEGGMLGAAGAGVEFEKGISNILCEVRNGRDTRRTLTDGSGKFSFPGLLPGSWILKVYERNIPSTHYIEQDSREFIVGPGESAQAELRVIPRIRNIIMMGEEEIIGSD